MKYAALLAVLLPAITFAGPLIKSDDSIALCGDSITEAKLYSVYVEDYLVMCAGLHDVKTQQFGWGGERTEGLANRMNNDVLRFHPTIATLCYGMNDGRYTPLSPEIGESYAKFLDKVVSTFEQSKVRVIVGSPGVVDTATFHNPNVTADLYNQNLHGLRDLAEQVAKQHNAVFADVYTPMFDAMKNAKAKYGSSYQFAGPDGVHPGANGHLVMAYAFLKAMGFDGNIGTVTVDLTAKKADATEGHAVQSFDGKSLVIQSSRYPFCFLPNPQDATDVTSAKTNRSILPFVPFNDELNRFTLIVKGAGGDMKITWGEKSKTFTADQLSKGVNLAAEFYDNPFLAKFTAVHKAALEQQSYEQRMEQKLIHSVPDYFEMLPDHQAAVDNLVDSATHADQEMMQATVKAAAAVVHTIKIEPTSDKL